MLTTVDAATAAHEIAEARDLANRILRHIRQMPFDLGDIDEHLASENLPAWTRAAHTIDERETFLEYVVYIGDPDGDTGWTYDSQAEAVALAAHMPAASIACRQLVAGPWTPVEVTR